MRPNQSLKLTEVAVGDFAARQSAENEANDGYVRATNYMELAVRRRSLAPVRYTACAYAKVMRHAEVVVSPKRIEKG